MAALIADVEPQVALQPVLAAARPARPWARKRCRGSVAACPPSAGSAARPCTAWAPSSSGSPCAPPWAACPGCPRDSSSPSTSHPRSCTTNRSSSCWRETDLSRLVIEITEHDAINDYEDTRRYLARLRARGARIAIDDVGAGYASLKHLLLLQPDMVKLDTSLTHDVHKSPKQQRW